MCDYGRFLADGLNDREIDRPLVRDDSGDRRLDWPSALSLLADELKNAPKPVVVASANLTNEALFALKRNLVDGARMEVVVPIDTGRPRRIKNGKGDWIESVDAHPNSSGARHLGLATADGASLEAYLRDGEGPFLILDAHAHPWLTSEAAAAAIADRRVAVLARTRTPLVDAATMVLPVASWAETEGTCTSSTGHVQLAKRSLTPAAQARPAWDIIFRLALELGLEQERNMSPHILFAEMAAEVAAFSGMSWGELVSGKPLAIRREVTGVG
jgi:NADH dehydrogenase/NADH:ubiquinone oxidoreductase subunit G